LLGASLAIFLYQSQPKFIISLTGNLIGRKIYTFLNAKYFFDVIYNYFIISIGLHSGYTVSKILDRGVIELLGPYGLSNYLINLGQNISKLDEGRITTYAMYMIIGLIILVFLVFTPLIVKENLLEPRLIIILLLAKFIQPFLSNDNFIYNPKNNNKII